MKEHRFWAVFGLTIIALCATGYARAQTPGTRVTSCDPATPNNALCLNWSAPATMSDGTPTILPMTYRIEQQFNGAAAWTQVASGLTATRFYVKNLPLGSYVFRVFVNCSPNCTESVPVVSNAKDATAPIVQPGPAVNPLVVQVTISDDRAPVFRVVGANGSPSRGEYFGSVPVGRECDGPVLFRYRGKSFRLVHVEPTELWGTADASRLAAPCA